VPKNGSGTGDRQCWRGYQNTGTGCGGYQGGEKDSSYPRSSKTPQGSDISEPWFSKDWTKIRVTTHTTIGSQPVLSQNRPFFKVLEITAGTSGYLIFVLLVGKGIISEA
jgi:hypothetical protein